MVNESESLYNVNDVFNGIYVHGNMLGDAMFYGSGAGKLPTASAVSSCLRPWATPVSIASNTM